MCECVPYLVEINGDVKEARGHSSKRMRVFKDTDLGHELSAMGTMQESEANTSEAAQEANKNRQKANELFERVRMVGKRGRKGEKGGGGFITWHVTRDTRIHTLVCTHVCM